jgi:formiminotetrahydrofolate cyclodeaminase
MATESDIGIAELQTFLRRVGSTDAVPGGGSVAAVACALAAALAEMVASLTASKPRYTETRNELEAMARRANELTVRSLELAEADSDAYQGFLNAMRLPKQTSDEIAARAEAMSIAADHAASVPLEVCRTAEAILDLLASARGKTLPAVATDVASGAAAAAAALRAASLNVLVNLSSISSEARRSELERESTRLLEKGQGLADAIDRGVRSELSLS